MVMWRSKVPCRQIIDSENVFWELKGWGFTRVFFNYIIFLRSSKIWNSCNFWYWMADNIFFNEAPYYLTEHVVNVVYLNPPQPPPWYEKPFWQRTTRQHWNVCRTRSQRVELLTREHRVRIYLVRYDRELVALRYLWGKISWYGMFSKVTPWYFQPGKYLIGKKKVGRKWLNFWPLTKISAD